MSNVKKQAMETLEIFAKAMGGYAPRFTDSWDDHGILSASFELDYLDVSARAHKDAAPGYIYASIYAPGVKKVVSIEAPAVVVLAAANMAIANHQVDSASV